MLTFDDLERDLDILRVVRRKALEDAAALCERMASGNENGFPPSDARFHLRRAASEILHLIRSDNPTN